ncbi:hypothetical protein ACH5RR_024349 [Cinchona calisaya]|uniref:Uncharacterized protein n=1 Tax=Cinchona calisaya TaxID=153742 RepID=A0ABD2YWF1_9GENT
MHCICCRTTLTWQRGFVAGLQGFIEENANNPQLRRDATFYYCYGEGLPSPYNPQPHLANLPTNPIQLHAAPANIPHGHPNLQQGPAYYNLQPHYLANLPTNHAQLQANNPHPHGHSNLQQGPAYYNHRLNNTQPHHLANLPTDHAQLHAPPANNPQPPPDHDPHAYQLSRSVAENLLDGSDFP